MAALNLAVLLLALVMTLIALNSSLPPPSFANMAPAPLVSPSVPVLNGSFANVGREATAGLHIPGRRGTCTNAMVLTYDQSTMVDLIYDAKCPCNALISLARQTPIMAARN